jgi:hypothetical protein
MATAVATLTVNGHPNGVDNTQRREILNGIMALNAGGTYATFGVPFTWKFLTAEGGAFIPNFNTMSPVWAAFLSLVGGTYQYLYDPVHGTLRIYQAGVELANAAAITADTIGFRAEFVRGV